MVKINWLASYPKSGNTWVRAFLEAYNRGSVNINSMAEVVGDSLYGRYQLHSALPLSELTVYQLLAVRLAALTNMLFSDARDGRLVLKTHFCNARIDDLPTIPHNFTGPSVYIVRDPRAVAVSYASFRRKPLDAIISTMQNHDLVIGSNKALKVETFLSSWDGHVKSWEINPHALVVRYEDLKADPETWFKKILEQYGYDYSQEKCQRAIELSQLERLKAQESQVGFKETPDDHQFFGGERPKLSKEQEREIINAFGETMEKYGYLEASQKVA